MFIEKAILCCLIAVTGVILIAFAAIFFGTSKFLIKLGALENKIYEQHRKLLANAKELTALQNDLALMRLQSQNKKCNCKE